MRVLLTSADFGIGYELTPTNKRIASQLERETGNESIRIASDWDFPGLARDLGWNMSATRKCTHRGTDGTVTCPDCGKSVGFFIDRATEYLDKRTDRIFQGKLDGYFEQF